MTDDPTRLEKGRFRDFTLAADGRLIVFASGKDRTRVETDGETDASGFLHTNFRLAATGSRLALYLPTSCRYLDATAIDYPLQQPDHTWGRAADGAFAVFEVATPGVPNPAPSTHVTQGHVEFSHGRSVSTHPST